MSHTVRIQGAGGRGVTNTAFGETGGKQAAAVSWSHLILIIQSDRPTAGGARYGLGDVAEILFSRGPVRRVIREGTGAETRLTVQVPSLFASESHARMKWTASGWLLEDLGSKNGTFVNGHRISERTTVRAGDIIQVGRVFFTVYDSIVRGEIDLSADLNSDEAEPSSLPTFTTLVPVLNDRLSRLCAAAKGREPISVIGATGTGKDVLANAIHQFSGRKGPFVAVNCGALAPNLVEGQLFGYVKGAYSGANRSDPGFVQAARRGTLFLDEILDLPLDAQVKLLRVLQEREVVALGTTRGEHVDVRFIAASQRPFKDVVESGRFRADLGARLAAHVIELPLLRERRVDIGLLLAAIFRRRGITETDGYILPSKAVHRILGYSWPNNIRELDYAVGNAILQASPDKILDYTAFPEPDVDLGAPVASEAPLTERDRELRNRLLDLLGKHDGVVADVAREMDTQRSQVYRWLNRFGLDLHSFRSTR
jgi:transcriptional regulator with PAS, ATPase and Fis domain